MSDYPIIRADGDEVDVKLNHFNSMFMERASARLLATRLVEVVGCEQLDAERKRNAELAEREAKLVDMLSRLLQCEDHRLRAALEGRWSPN